MEKFFRIKSVKEYNILNEGDVYFFYDKERTIKSISKNYVTFDCGTQFPNRLFAKWVRMDNVITKAHNDSVATRKKNKIKETKSKIYLQPVNALRYIILENYSNNEISWSFADRFTSHADLEKDYQTVYGREWTAVAGGFYCYRKANAVALYDEDEKLELFGKSDSFGLNPDVYIKAKPLLSTLVSSETIIDDSWIKNYFKNYYKREM